MVDNISKQRRSQNMAAIRSKGTNPEMIVRRIIHKMGCRYRLHKKDLPGKPDLVFPGRHKIIFVHGCFWHQHKSSKCKISRVPKSSQEYWVPKLKRNQQRDLQHQKTLRNLGWKVTVIWECETKDIDKITKRITAFLEG